MSRIILVLTNPAFRFSVISEYNSESRIRDIMKILIILILCLIVLMMGCSDSFDRGQALWEKRQMDDDQRIYENPYESPNQLQSVWLPSPC